ncbi:MAG: putative permease [Deltaproteobacteria bacterium]|nr:putative permease [Deltaproteobacteria bacterium]
MLPQAKIGDHLGLLRIDRRKESADRYTKEPRMNQSVKFPLIDTILRIVVLFVLIAWCAAIILPFLEPVIWGAIIAVTLHPFFARVKRWMGNRNMLAGVLLTVLILVILLLPSAWLIKSLVEGVQGLVIQFRNQTLVIPPPDPSVAGWPLIGKPISEIWLLAHQSLESAITTYREPLSKLGMTFLGPLGGFGKSLVMFFVSVIIAGVFLIKADASAGFVRKLIRRLAGERSDEIVPVAGVTIQNVAKGILGVAFFQFLTAGMVFMLAGVPFAGLWAFAVLILAILQLPSVIVILPVIIYLFSVKALMPAILWTVALLVVALSDNVLKPLLMGKGSPVPMLVIFLGAIGGFIFSGLLGLFTGAMVLSVGYNLMVHWIDEGQN